MRRIKLVTRVLNAHATAFIHDRRNQVVVDESILALLGYNAEVRRHLSDFIRIAGEEKPAIYVRVERICVI